MGSQCCWHHLGAVKSYRPLGKPSGVIAFRGCDSITYSKLNNPCLGLKPHFCFFLRNGRDGYTLPVSKLTSFLLLSQEGHNFGKSLPQCERAPCYQHGAFHSSHLDDKSPSGCGVLPLARDASHFQLVAELAMQDCPFPMESEFEHRHCKTT